MDCVKDKSFDHDAGMRATDGVCAGVLVFKHMPTYAYYTDQCKHISPGGRKECLCVVLPPDDYTSHRGACRSYGATGKAWQRVCITRYKFLILWEAFQRRRLNGPKMAQWQKPMLCWKLFQLHIRFHLTSNTSPAHSGLDSIYLVTTLYIYINLVICSFPHTRGHHSHFLGPCLFPFSARWC